MGCLESSVDNGVKVLQTNDLFQPFQFGEFQVKNRVMMAAMTRCRSDNGVPNEIMVKYYSERSEDAGVILTECIPISRRGNSFLAAGAGYTQEHADGWKKVVDAVHSKGGKIVAQVYHCGRSASKEELGGLSAVSASVIRNRYGGKYDAPVELSIPEIKNIVKDFAKSAQLLKSSGFDGIQLHGANGYLVDQFLRDATNNRKDEYGGSVKNRSKFLLEIIDEFIKIFGSKKVGIKLSPVGRFNDMFDSNPKEILDYLLPQLNNRKICFVEICQAPDPYIENLYGVNGEDQIRDIYQISKPLLSNVVLVGNNGLTEDSSKQLLKEGKIDMVSFGKYYMANPDVVSRMKNKQPLNNPDFQYAFAGGEKGYCDISKFQ